MELGQAVSLFLKTVSKNVSSAIKVFSCTLRHSPEQELVFKLLYLCP